MSVHLLRADARALPLPDASVDLIVTSPPYWAQRDYQDEGGSLAGQLGAEATLTEYIDNLLDCTVEWMRVLRSTGSMWVNLGDKYATRWSSQRPTGRRGLARTFRDRDGANDSGVPEKSLIGLPWRYALGCVDELGLTLRAEVVWSKPNGLPESATDRVRRSHETWLHLTKAPRYYAAVDAVREPHVSAWNQGPNAGGKYAERVTAGAKDSNLPNSAPHPLGKLPGSVWSIPTQPLDVPPELGIDHHAAFPMEWPRRIIRGWSPREVCTRCGEGLRPTSQRIEVDDTRQRTGTTGRDPSWQAINRAAWSEGVRRQITGWECDCNASIPTPAGAGGHADTSHVTGRAGFGREGRDQAVVRTVTRWEQRHYARQLASHPHRSEMAAELGRPLDHYAKTSTSSGRPLPDHLLRSWLDRGWLTPAPPYTPAPTRAGVVLDPFGGTGTTALVADVEGRVGISADLSSDYLRLARWRTTDPRQRAVAAQTEWRAPEPVAAGQGSLFDA